jgi:hypothetical protein
MRVIIWSILLILIFENSDCFKLNDSPVEKSWETICSILSCKPVLDKCIENDCIGIDQCKACVQSQNRNCNRCVDELLKEQLFSINGTQTIICDPMNNLHQTTCGFYCRMSENLDAKCQQVGDNPLCVCKKSEGALLSKTKSDLKKGNN